MAPVSRLARACAGFDPVRVLQKNTLPAKRRDHLVVIAALEHGADVVVQHLHLIAGDLRPTGVVADDGDNRDVVAREGVELGKRIADRAVAEQNPSSPTAATSSRRRAIS